MKINAKVTNILFPSTLPVAGKQWYVLATTSGKVVGSTRLPLKEKHYYTFVGDFATYQGQLNFKFTSVHEEIPVDPKELLDYACHLTKGLGLAYADQIWSAYGADYYNALRSKENLKSRDKSLLKTLDELGEDVERTQVISFLMAKGATQHLAELAYGTLGVTCSSLVRENLYILAELPGQSFKTIDERFRESFGIDLLDPRRIESFIAYTINNKAETDGDTIFSIDEMAYEAVNNLNIPEEAFRKTIEESNQFVKVGEGVTTARLYYAELAILNYTAPNRTCITVTPILPTDMTLDASQVNAVTSALSSTRLTIINGGAGCGKTTIIKTIAESLMCSCREVALCAFAGKAAARLREATGVSASTIHSLLKYIPEQGFSRENLHGVSVIVDESSMVPAYLLAEICKRDPERLILVGDEGQLPPVGAGAPFHDLVRIGLAKTVTTCYRNAEAIFQAAYAVRNGDSPQSAKSKREAFTLVGVRNAEAAQDYIAKSIIPLLDFEQDIIIAPRNGTESENSDTLPASVNSLNASVMASLGIDAPITIDARIICTKNNPAKDVWNGTTGTIRAIDTDGNVYYELDDGGEAKLPREYCAKHTAPAYALTIHKAQGSQYRRVVIVCLRRDMHTLLDRQMLYTAITRAKEGCLVVTDIGLDAIVAKSTHRNTILSTLLQEANNETALA